MNLGLVKWKYEHASPNHTYIDNTNFHGQFPTLYIIIMGLFVCHKIHWLLATYIVLANSKYLNPLTTCLFCCCCCFCFVFVLYFIFLFCICMCVYACTCMCTCVRVCLRA